MCFRQKLNSEISLFDKRWARILGARTLGDGLKALVRDDRRGASAGEVFVRSAFRKRGVAVVARAKKQKAQMGTAVG